MVLLASLFAYAGDMQDIAKDRGNQILDMLGPAGLFAIFGSIVMVRAVRALRYFTKQASFLTTLAVSAAIGAGSAWAGAGADTSREILAGAFLCMVGTPLAYEASKWILAVAYERTKWEIFRALYFTLCPKPLQKYEVETSPDGELTKFFNDKTEPK
jgi:hypothetical protein